MCSRMCSSVPDLCSPDASGISPGYDNQKCFQMLWILPRRHNHPDGEPPDHAIRRMVLRLNMLSVLLEENEQIFVKH